MKNMTESHKKNTVHYCSGIVKKLVLDQKSIIILGLCTNNQFLSKIS